MSLAKKIALISAGLGLVFMGIGFSGAHAQTATPTVPPVTPAPTGTLTPTPASATPSAGYIQFNDLAVTSISAGTSSASGSTSGAVIIATPLSQPGTCLSFTGPTDTVGTSVSCPIPPTGTVSTSSPTGTYSIDLTGSTQLLLSNRATAILGNITSGDVINVYGYYDGAGNVQAQIVRDLSKPAAPGVIGTPVPATTSGVSPTTPPAVGTNPTQGQLLQILQTLMIQVQGVLTQLIQMSGTTVPNATGTGTGNTNTSSAVGQVPMIPPPSPSPSPSPTVTP
jgi:hypothetical protein